MPREQSIGFPVELSKRNIHKYQDDVNRANDLLKAAKEYRRETREPTWESNERQYADVRRPGDTASLPWQKRLGINLSFSTVSTLTSYITGEVPYLGVIPLSQSSSRTKALFHQSWLNALARSADFGFAEPATDAVWDSRVYGEGYFLPRHDILTLPVRNKDGLPTGETYTKVKQQAQYVNPWDVWVDPLAPSKMKGRFIVRRVLRTREEVENDDDLRIPEDIALVPYKPDDADDKPALSTSSHKQKVATALDLVEIYDFYDLANEKLITFIPGTSKPLRIVEEIACPISPIDNHKLPNTPYCASDLEMVASIANALNETAEKIRDHAEKGNRKTIIDKDVLDEEAVQALRSPIPDDVVLADLKQSGIALKDAIYEIKPSPAPGDLYNLWQMLPDMLDEVSGVTEFQKGQTPDTRQTATATNILKEASNAKTASSLRRIEASFRRFWQTTLDHGRDLYPLTEFDELAMWIPQHEAQRILYTAVSEGQEQLIATYLEMEPGEQVDGNEVAGMWVAPTEELFVGAYEVRVHPNSTELQNPTLRAQKYAGVLQMVMELTSSGLLEAPNVKRAAEMWLRAEGIDNPEELLNMRPERPVMAPNQAQPQGPAQEQPQASLAALGPSVEGVDDAYLEDPDLF